MKGKNLLFKRALLTLCLLAVCWLTMRAEVMPGDVNSDGEVSIADVVELIDYLLTDDDSMINIANADVNQDGQVDIADVSSLIDILLLMPANPQQEHEWVDLGLPSGTLWATCNVGANAPEEYGDYFAWGETEPKDYYDWSTYKWCNGSLWTLTKYCANSDYGFNGFVDWKRVLEPADDAATVNWGPSWRIPTFQQIAELYEQCTSRWMTRNGVDGRLVTGPNGNTLFLPAAGRRCEGSLCDASAGAYWSRTNDDGYAAWYLNFISADWDWHVFYRDNGLTVRAVRVL